MTAAGSPAVRLAIAAVAGVLFALGLLLAGMTQPTKVIGFLDITGDWDPSLAFVMMGAIGVHLIAYWLIRGRAAPLFDAKFHLPTRRDLDRRLIAGAAIFGVGWGLAGYCPGPAVVSVAAGGPTLAFFAAMLVGIVAQRVLDRPTARGEVV